MPTKIAKWRALFPPRQDIINMSEILLQQSNTL